PRRVKSADGGRSGSGTSRQCAAESLSGHRGHRTIRTISDPEPGQARRAGTHKQAVNAHNCQLDDGEVHLHVTRCCRGDHKHDRRSKSHPAFAFSPAASMPATAQASSLSEVSPLTPTAPSKILPSWIKTPPG